MLKLKIRRIKKNKMKLKIRACVWAAIGNPNSNITHVDGFGSIGSRGMKRKNRFVMRYEPNDTNAPCDMEKILKTPTSLDGK